MSAIADLLAALPIPIIQAPMLGASSPDMAVAVSDAGAMGTLAATAHRPDALEAEIAAMKVRTAGPFGVNLLVARQVTASGEVLAAARARLAPWYAELGLPEPDVPNDFTGHIPEQVAAIARARPAAASFAFDVPTPAEVAQLKAAGVPIIGTATTVAEARAWASLGADAVCAQGFEAGGHRGHFLAETEASLVGTMALVPAVRAAVDLPVIAAGGIMDGAGVAAALALGAAAVQMGTAFLLADEALVSAPWRHAIETAADDPTRLTSAITGRHARGIETRFMRELRPFEGEMPPYPVQNRLTQPLRVAAAKAANTDVLSLWAGQGVRLARHGPAGDLVRQFWAEAQDTAKALAARVGG
ncbi:MAG TPA: nitronate monooxygenase [Caulobacteraceae bacterium]|jgi:nitronate monooxygenase